GRRPAAPKYRPEQSGPPTRAPDRAGGCAAKDHSARRASRFAPFWNALVVVLLNSLSLSPLVWTVVPLPGRGRRRFLLLYRRAVRRRLSHATFAVYRNDQPISFTDTKRVCEVRDDLITLLKDAKHLVKFCVIRLEVARFLHEPGAIVRALDY